MIDINEMISKAVGIEPTRFADPNWVSKNENSIKGIEFVPIGTRIKADFANEDGEVFKTEIFVKIEEFRFMPVNLDGDDCDIAVKFTA